MLEVLQLLQNAGMVPPASIAHSALQNADALFGGTGVPLPSTVILDYIYGIAAYNAWRSERVDGFDQMEKYHNEITHRFGHVALPHQVMTPMLLLDQAIRTTPIINPPGHGTTTLQQGGVVWSKPWTNSICF